MFNKILFVLLLTALPLTATAGRLLKCEGISTANGYRYVGTYCINFECTYVKRLVFRSWCPYNA